MILLADRGRYEVYGALIDLPRRCSKHFTLGVGRSDAHGHRPQFVPSTELRVHTSLRRKSAK